MPTLLVHYGLPTPVDGSELEGKRDDLTVVRSRSCGENRELLADADVVVTANGLWDDAFLDSLEAGDWVQTIGAGYDAYPTERFREAGVVLTNAPGIHGATAAEHVMALALAFSRRLPEFFELQGRHEWDRRIGGEVTDRTMTVLGLGEIGRVVADRARAFEMDVWGVKRDPTTHDSPLSDDRVVGPDALGEVLPATDVLVVTLPLTPETRGIVGATELDALPDDATLINVGRGGLVEEDALVAALREGRLGGAGLDVFETEPLPEESPLWDVENVVVTPHLAGVSDRYPERFAALFLEAYDRWRAGEPLRHRIT